MTNSSEYDTKNATPAGKNAQSQCKSYSSHDKTVGQERLDFEAKAESEFILGSAIEPNVFASSVRLVSDIEQLPGGDVETPIHDALNWRYTRFGYQVRSTMFAVLLLNEDGSCWQAKLSQFRLDEEKTRRKLKKKLGRVRTGDVKALAKVHPDCAEHVKYDTPIGNGSRAFLPAIHVKTRKLISKRLDVQVPLSGSFWDWLEQHPEIPIVFTEGGKKALSLLSLGYVAIALIGVDGGYVKCKVTGDRSLIPDVARFAVASRQTLLAFDQDAEAKTRSRVDGALRTFGYLLQKAGSSAAIASWDGHDGKGADDLIVNCGAEAIDRAVAEALPLTHWYQWQRLENRLTYPVNLRVNTADLSTLDVGCLPAEGIIGVAAAKGTGKTKLLAATVRIADKVLAAGHRIALMRNLCERLKLDYRGDLDKVRGEFINGSGYALRIGFCVDSLLAIDLEKFAGCDLILDEVVQVIRHLLTSSTCAKEGMRPALLARFVELIRVARRVIVADADLDNATLHYLQQLRGGNAPVFLIRNDYQAAGYPARFIHSKSKTAVVEELLQDAEKLPKGKTLFVTTDSKASSKLLHQTFKQQQPNLRVLLINSETSGSEEVQRFMKEPDRYIGLYDVVIATPSMATGVSIEVQGVVQRVYGIFSGYSSTDADMAQALVRVREPVERVIWCAEHGKNFSKVGRATNRIEMETLLRDRTSATVSLVRSELGLETARQVEGYDWQADPHLKMYCEIAAAQNRSMYSLRDALLVRLKHEGHQIKEVGLEADEATKLLLKQVKAELKEFEAEAILKAKVIGIDEVLKLQGKEGISPEDQLAVERFRLCDDLVIEPDALTIEIILADANGRRRRELFNLEAQLSPELATERTVGSIEFQDSWGEGYTPWDFSGAKVRQKLRSRLGLDELIVKARKGQKWTKYDAVDIAAKARAASSHVKNVLNFSIPTGTQPNGQPKMSDTQIVGELLRQLGIKTVSHRSRTVEGHENEVLWVYGLDAAHWEETIAILERRQARREAIHRADLPPQFLMEQQEGGRSAMESPGSRDDALFSPECLADFRNELAAAETPEVREAVLQMFSEIDPRILQLVS